jgi:hypothetical protein
MATTVLRRVYVFQVVLVLSAFVFERESTVYLSYKIAKWWLRRGCGGSVGMWWLSGDAMA